MQPIAHFAADSASGRKRFGSIHAAGAVLLLVAFQALAEEPTPTPAVPAAEKVCERCGGKGVVGYGSIWRECSCKNPAAASEKVPDGYLEFITTEGLKTLVAIPSIGSVIEFAASEGNSGTTTILDNKTGKFIVQVEGHKADAILKAISSYKENPLPAPVARGKRVMIELHFGIPLGKDLKADTTAEMKPYLKVTEE